MEEQHILDLTLCCLNRGRKGLWPWAVSLMQQKRLVNHHHLQAFFASQNAQISPKLTFEVLKVIIFRLKSNITD
jgi:hypothetical protein